MLESLLNLVNLRGGAFLASSYCFNSSLDIRFTSS